MAVVSVGGQLFVEHTSLINIVFACCVLVYFIKTKAKKSTIVLSSLWLSGTIIGMSIMLLIPKLFYVSNEWDNYQKVNVNSLHDFVISVVANGMQIAGIYLQNVFALMMISIVLIILAKPRTTAKGVLLFVPIYGFAVNYIVSDIWSDTVCGMVNLLLLSLYVITVVTVIVMEKSIERKTSILFFIAMSVFSVLPLLIVYPIGSRCLLHSYVFLILAVLSLISNSKTANLKFDKNMTAMCIATSCLLLCFLIIHFQQVGAIDRERLEYVQERVEDGAEKIIVPRIPSIYVKDNNGWSYGQVFYQLEKLDIQFEFIDYQTWKDNIE